MTIDGKRILIIDDDRAMLRALTKVLTKEGAVVTMANWAGDAIDHLTDKLEAFDLVITDLRMPILGGETILSAVKVALPQLPVIIITAFGNPDLKTDCLHKGAAAFLEKPIGAPQLLETVGQALAPSNSTSAHRPRRATRADKPKDQDLEDSTTGQE